MKKFLTAVALAIVACSTSGCAAVLAGYLIGKGISDDKTEQACRANLKIQNDQRLAEHKDLFPDMCSR